MQLVDQKRRNAYRNKRAKNIFKRNIRKREQQHDKVGQKICFGDAAARCFGNNEGKGVVTPRGTAFPHHQTDADADENATDDRGEKRGAAKVRQYVAVRLVQIIAERKTDTGKNGIFLSAQDL